MNAFGKILITLTVILGIGAWLADNQETSQIRRSTQSTVTAGAAKKPVSAYNADGTHKGGSVKGQAPKVGWVCDHYLAERYWAMTDEEALACATSYMDTALRKVARAENSGTLMRCADQQSVRKHIRRHMSVMQKTGTVYDPAMYTDALATPILSGRCRND